ncbi:patatin-like phospholipase family protein [Simkania sp.]|uniref:patatin-like phospholipase family protein n=1 Tax=Simkania sp. TaxID=34094 RepID=UPI003B516C29
MSRFIFVICLVLSFSLGAQETRILSLDGGGVRGVVSLSLLSHLQEGTGINYRDDFDIYAGTSTGAIIAVALACGMDVNEILKAYKTLSAEVFSDGSYLSVFKPEYSQDKLKHNIKKILQACGLSDDVLVRDLPQKIIITTVNLDDKEVHRWRMDFIENITPDGGNIKVVDAILESTAAPTYFPAEHDHVDGGMGMNDPTLAALMFAYEPTDDLRDFVILSVGTGYDPRYVKGGEDWGTYDWITHGSPHSGSPALVNLLMDVEAQIPEQVASKLLGDRYRKLNFALPKAIGLDDYKSIDHLLKYTREFIGNDLTGWHETIAWTNEHLGKR